MKKILSCIGAVVVMSSSYTFAAETNVKVAKAGDTVAVDYTLTLPDKTIADTSVEAIAKKAGIHTANRIYQPLQFTIGQNEVIKGFEDGIVGMKIGQTKVITLQPKDAYGEKDPNKVVTYDSTLFQYAGINPEIGKSYSIGGSVMTVVDIKGNNIIVDGNHPMAGKVLTFSLKLQNILLTLPTELQGFPQGSLSSIQIKRMMANTFRYGNTKGDLVLIEYSDPSCPFCKRHFQDKTIEKIMVKYPTVEHIFKPVEGVNHTNTKYKSNAILCAGKVGGATAYKGMYSLLLQESLEDDTITAILPYVKKNLDEKKWTACMNNNEMNFRYVANWKEFNTLTSSPGTPSTLILNKKTGQWIMVAGAYPVDTFYQAIDVIK